LGDGAAQGDKVPRQGRAVAGAALDATPMPSLASLALVIRGRRPRPR